jgi:hypothetical protein
MVMARKINYNKPGVTQIKISPDLVKQAKIVYVKAFSDDYETQDNLANKVFEFFINNALPQAANQSK